MVLAKEKEENNINNIAVQRCSTDPLKYTSLYLCWEEFKAKYHHNPTLPSPEMYLSNPPLIINIITCDN